MLIALACTFYATYFCVRERRIQREMVQAEALREARRKAFREELAKGFCPGCGERVVRLHRNGEVSVYHWCEQTRDFFEGEQ